MKSSFLQPPEFLTLPVFGMSISQNSVRLMKLKKTPKGFIPSVAEEIYFKEDCDYFVNPESTSDCQEFKKILRELKKKHKINFVQLSIPEEKTYIFDMEVPKSAEDLIEEYIKNNVEQYIPMSAAEVFFDYKVLKLQVTEEMIPVVVTVVPKIIVERYTSLFESVGILVIKCEPETHSIARCVIDKGDINPYIIININEYSTSVSIVEEGLIRYTQTVPVQTQDIVQEISPETAATLKDTIHKVIIYWFTSKEHSNQNSKIENIIITGKDVESSDLINFFESNLSVNVAFANVWKNCFDINVHIPTISKKDSLKYATCIGLSLFKVK